MSAPAASAAPTTTYQSQDQQQHNGSNEGVYDQSNDTCPKVNTQSRCPSNRQQLNVIKSGGEWISSVDVEGIVYAHPVVKMAAVVGAAHPKWEERPVLIVALKESQQLSEKELMEFLRPRMARWW